MEPVLRLSRIAAQFAPLVTVELIPYFLNKPFSCAMTMGEQSVSAMMPKFSAVVSGPSAAKALPTQPFGSPANRAVSVAPRTARRRNWRRFSGDLTADSGVDRGVVMGCNGLGCTAKNVRMEDVQAGDCAGI